MSLIRDGPADATSGIKRHRAKIMVETEPFADVMKRKRVRIEASSLADLAGDAEKNNDAFEERQEKVREEATASGETGGAGENGFEDETQISEAREAIFSKGQSKRIWNELYRYAQLIKEISGPD
jgi:nuclear GTP-binding protein